MSDAVHVLVGLISNQAGQYLINQRGIGQHMAGSWEFPGGKRNPGERRWDALSRELNEELGISIRSADPFVEILHDYPDRRVRLDVWIVRDFDGEVRAREGQAIRWVSLADLRHCDLLAADRPIIDALKAAPCSSSHAASQPERSSAT